MPKRYFRPVHTKNTRPSTRRPPGRNHLIAGQKAQLHEPARNIFGQIESIENAALPHREIGERLDDSMQDGFSSSLPETHAI
jgi:hypothetical protein